jgi:hypothetical protein
LEEGASILFSFNFPFALKTILYFAPLIYILVELARVSMKDILILSLNGIFKEGVIFQIVKVPTTLEKMKSRPILEHVLPEHNVICLRVSLNLHMIGELINGIPK